MDEDDKETAKKISTTLSLIEKVHGTEEKEKVGAKMAKMKKRLHNYTSKMRKA